MIGWWAIACVGRQPFLNEPPRLLSVNEQVVERSVVLVRLDPPVPGEPYALRFEVEDPERDRVEILFPEAPGEVRFDPDEREGVWVPPPDRPTAWLRVYLQDDGTPPAGETYDLAFGGLGGSGG
ncbi:MAG: hypothetical protein H6738_20095 [Alphaproteobacteria bacterium]|nr:hypothetical protein [Alphaproteobacteria bacterium]MCB9699094.1 hypothetical protein [Alphaproteobacteria bacterium]